MKQWLFLIFIIAQAYSFNSYAVFQKVNFDTGIDFANGQKKLYPVRACDLYGRVEVNHDSIDFTEEAHCPGVLEIWPENFCIHYKFSVVDKDIFYSGHKVGVVESEGGYSIQIDFQEKITKVLDLQLRTIEPWLNEVDRDDYPRIRHRLEVLHRPQMRIEIKKTEDFKHLIHVTKTENNQFLRSNWDSNRFNQALSDYKSFVQRSFIATEAGENGCNILREP